VGQKQSIKEFVGDPDLDHEFFSLLKHCKFVRFFNLSELKFLLHSLDQSAPKRFRDDFLVSLGAAWHSLI